MAVSTLGLYGGPFMEGNGSFAGKTEAAAVQPLRSTLSIAIQIGLCLTLIFIG